ncbi:hypothetical protein [Nonomuraea sp. NPDC049695]|uniref:hypothetical protein n=1 Tax=Nonomuraea sp. NPDC049695 TaxID=3154734 RepID=UPI00342DA462
MTGPRPARRRLMRLAEHDIKMSASTYYAAKSGKGIGWLAAPSSDGCVPSVRTVPGAARRSAPPRLSWAASPTKHTTLVLDALDMAL